MTSPVIRWTPRTASPAEIEIVHSAPFSGWRGGRNRSASAGGRQDGRTDRSTEPTTQPPPSSARGSAQQNPPANRAVEARCGLSQRAGRSPHGPKPDADQSTPRRRRGCSVFPAPFRSVALVRLVVAGQGCRRHRDGGATRRRSALEAPPPTVATLGESEQSGNPNLGTSQTRPSQNPHPGTSRPRSRTRNQPNTAVNQPRDPADYSHKPTRIKPHPCHLSISSAKILIRQTTRGDEIRG